MIRDLQEEVRQLKASNYTYKNVNDELKCQILNHKSKEYEDKSFECDLCNHKLKRKVDFINHTVVIHTSNEKMDNDLEDKFHTLEVKNDELTESNNSYQVELEIKEEIIEEIKLKFTKIYTELMQRKET